MKFIIWFTAVWIVWIFAVLILPIPPVLNSLTTLAIAFFTFDRLRPP